MFVNSPFKGIIQTGVDPCQMYRVFFFNWHPPEFAECCPVSNRLQNSVRVPDRHPPIIEKV